MIAAGFAMMLLLAATGADARADDQPRPTEYAQLTVRQRIVVRVAAVPLSPTPRRWKEKKGPRCIPMKDVAGAAIIKKDRVDLILKGGARVRAEFESSCPALDYYSGFYVSPSIDTDICADRDSIHTRAGGECQITRFRKLVPDR